MLLKNKVAVLTGGGSGIGLSTAKLFSKEGASVVIVDVNQELAEKATKEINESGGDAFFIKGDVSNQEEVNENVKNIIRKYGKIDILFNNAGIDITEPALEVKKEDWQKVISINLDGVFYWAQAVAKQSMIPNKSGSIINVSSMAGIAAIPDGVSYVSSKHAVVGLTKSLAIEWGKHNIRVNCLCPGLTETPMVEYLSSKKPSLIENRRKRIPLERTCKPEEQAEAALFLASDKASYVNGLIMNVDGGMNALFSGYSLN